jgi:hypothetical protein
LVGSPGISAVLKNAIPLIELNGTDIDNLDDPLAGKLLMYNGNVS